ncbi:MAG: hypothetical protein LBR91_03885 [Puniceicoccales bacterium]|nr:hypothetical protein [Puniceicoccales bacterium]
MKFLPAVIYIACDGIRSNQRSIAPVFVPVRLANNRITLNKGILFNDI